MTKFTVCVIIKLFIVFVILWMRNDDSEYFVNVFVPLVGRVVRKGRNTFQIVSVP
jgi:hypothetical protein